MPRRFVVALTAAVLVAACHEGEPHPHGDGGGTWQPPLALGTFQAVADVVFPAAGGAVTLPDGPLAGLRVEVPAGAWSQDVKVTVGLTPVNEVRVDGVRAASALIHLDVDGPTFVPEPVEVFVPGETTDDDEVAMVFGYDVARSVLEAMPSYPEAGGTVFVTQHFSPYLVLLTQRVKLDEALPTPFVYGVDDFALVNEGSYLTPSGFCSGQVVSALTYYASRRVDGGAPLVSYADEQPPGFGPSTRLTQAFYADDRRAWQLASAVQEESVFSLENWGKWRHLEQRSTPALVDQLASAALYVTKHPQLLSIRRVTEDGGRSGHALLTFGKVRGDGGMHYLVSDPNYPWRASAPSPRDVFYAADAGFTPYAGKRNAADDTRQYTQFAFVGTWAFVPRETVETLWQRFDDDTLGDGFPEAPLVAKASTVPGNPQVSLGRGGVVARTDDVLEVGLDPEPFHWRIRIYGPDGAEKASGNKTVGDSVSLLLRRGDNLLGIRVDGRSGTQVPNFEWVDFRWVTVRYQPPVVGEPVVLGQVALSGPARAVTVKGTTAYVLTDERLVLVDVSSDAAPRVLSDQVLSGHSTARGLAVGDDGYAWAGAGSFKIVDVLDPLQVAVVSTTGFNANCGRLEARGAHAFVACGTKTYVSEGLLGIADVADAGSGATNRAVGAVTWSRTVKDVALSADGKTAFLLGTSGSVAAFDVTNPRAPGTAPLSTLTGEASVPWALDLEGTTLFVAADGLRLANVAAPAALAWLGGDPYTDVRDVDAFGTRAAAVGAQGSEGRFWLYDVENPLAPTVTKTLPLSMPATAVQVVGNKAYVTTANAAGDGVLLVVGF